MDALPAEGGLEKETVGLVPPVLGPKLDEEASIGARSPAEAVREDLASEPFRLAVAEVSPLPRPVPNVAVGLRSEGRDRAGELLAAS